MPIMSGHNPEVKDDFISFTDDAKKSRITFFHAMEKKYMLCMECQWVEF